MIDLITRDQLIYTSWARRDLQTTSRVRAIELLADQFHIGKESVKMVIKHYEKFYRQWLRTPSTGMLT